MLKSLQTLNHDDVRRHDSTVHYIFYDDVRRHDSSKVVNQDSEKEHHACRPPLMFVAAPSKSTGHVTAHAYSSSSEVET